MESPSGGGQNIHILDTRTRDEIVNSAVFIGPRDPWPFWQHVDPGSFRQLEEPGSVSAAFGYRLFPQPLQLGRFGNL